MLNLTPKQLRRTPLARLLLSFNAALQMDGLETSWAQAPADAEEKNAVRAKIRAIRQSAEIFNQQHTQTA